jgi:hypothetical protein
MGVAAARSVHAAEPLLAQVRRERTGVNARHAARLRLAATAIKAAWIEAAGSAGVAFGAGALGTISDAWLESRAAAEHHTLIAMADLIENGLTEGLHDI